MADDTEGSLNGFKYDGWTIEDSKHPSAIVKLTSPDGLVFSLVDRNALVRAVSIQVVPYHVADIIATAYGWDDE